VSDLGEFISDVLNVDCDMGEFKLDEHIVESELGRFNVTYLN